MPKWTVILRDPLYTQSTAASELYKEVIEADTEYGAKKAFFDSLLTNHPEVPKAPFFTILPYLKIKKMESQKPKLSEFPPENFFTAVRSLKKTSIKEELENSRYLIPLITFIIEESLELNRIPKKCPICRRPTNKLELHHWNGQESPGHPSLSKNFSIMHGLYRRLCPSCNVSLGQVFKGSYPIDWKDQLSELEIYFQRFPKTYTLPLKEEEWSLLTEEEWNRLKDIWDHVPRRILQEAFKHRRNKRYLLKATK